MFTWRTCVGRPHFSIQVHGSRCPNSRPDFLKGPQILCLLMWARESLSVCHLLHFILLLPCNGRTLYMEKDWLQIGRGDSENELFSVVVSASVFESCNPGSSLAATLQFSACTTIQGSLLQWDIATGLHWDWMSKVLACMTIWVMAQIPPRLEGVIPLRQGLLDNIVKRTWNLSLQV